MLRRRIEKKIEDMLGIDQFGLRRGKGVGDAIWMRRIIPERTLVIDGELSACLTVGRINADPTEQNTGFNWRGR
jgi:hypothetical protein